MAKRHTEWVSGEDRAVAAVSNAIAHVVNSDRPEVIEAEAKEHARVLAEFLRILMAIDAEQKALANKF